MAAVHQFPLDNDLYTDTRIPFQFRGGGKSAAARAFELGTLVDFVQDNLNLSPVANTVTVGSPSISVPAGRLVEKIVVVGTTTGTFQLGTTSGGAEILDNTSQYTPTGAVFVFNQYFHAAGALHFSAFSGTLTVKVYTR